MNKKMDEKFENPYDLNSTNFNPDMYLLKLQKTCNLKQIMDVEAEIAKGTQTLHSEMQTLVYENYNKFISATDAIRRMQNDFKNMEHEMDKLGETMSEITQSTDQITGTLEDTRTHLTKLYEKNALLKRLSAISTLPSKLTQLVQEKNYAQAVQEYHRAQKILQQYGHQATFQGIQEDCSKIMEDLKKALKDDFKKSGNKTSLLTETGDLLLKLDEKPSDLSKEMLQFGSQRLYEQITFMKDQTDRDMIEFVDMGIEGFLNDITLISSSFNDMFVTKHFNSEDDGFQELALGNLTDFVTKNMTEYMNLVKERIDNETDDSQILLRALDRLNRRLCAMQSLGRNLYSSNSGTDLIIHSVDRLCKSHHKVLKDCFNDNLSSIRLSLVSSKNDGMSLNELISTLYVNTIEKIRAVLKDMCIFLNPTWSFSTLFKNDPKGISCIDRIRENLLIAFLQHILNVISAFSETNSSCPANLLLVLSKVCMKFESGGVQMQFSLFDELFELDSESSSVKKESELVAKMLDTAKLLVDAYVRAQGRNISMMVRKSVETRDWISTTLEPRSVRAVMKRILDELTNIDATLEQIFESEALKTTASSDSSRRTHGSVSIQSGRQPHKSPWSNYASSSHLDTNFVHRLFSERIDIFNSQVEFSKNSVFSGIIKITLKTFLECVRLQTFSKYGLQQIQVDTHFLQLNLWKFVSDENVIHFLLDDILGSTVLRCFEKDKSGLLMEPNAVEIICERF